MQSDQWDIEAKSDGATSMSQKLEMLQSLLEERFHLKFHRERKDAPGYSVVIVKNGPKLHEVQDGEVNACAPGTKIRRGLIDGHAVPIAQLAGFLRSQLGRPVTDNSKLAGKYDFRLEWVPDESQPTSGGAIPPPDASGPTIFTAVQEQLGLRLEAQKVPVEILVIDHAERPSAN
jgi:uncharacterized protein (TIGR03435 family)